MVLWKELKPEIYTWILLVVAGMGGLLYGVDIGIIAAALLYVSKTIDLSIAQTSIIVAAVLGGSVASSLITGFLADWVGRKKMMVLAGLLFVLSVVIIVLSQGFASLLAGRLLQGLSGGMIAVVVPLYLAECLAPQDRGKGSAVFQFMLTFGILAAAISGFYYTSHAEQAIVAAAGQPTLIRSIEDHAWRSMFLAALYPGVAFVFGSASMIESPRWLFLKGRHGEALAAMRKLSSEEEACRQLREMEEIAAEESCAAKIRGAADSLLQRKYVVPFLLACMILACTQATGMGSVLAYLVLILKQAGMSASHATRGDFAVKLLNCCMTIVAIALIDRRGRKFLLLIGTGGIIISLSVAALFFHSFEAQRVDVLAQIRPAIVGRQLVYPIQAIKVRDDKAHKRTHVLTVLYTYGDGDRITSVLSSGTTSRLMIEPPANASSPLVIKRATYGPVPTEKTGWIIAGCMASFIAFFSIGPGVVVWLALSELMPTRIRAAGMGIALLLNQGVSALIAGLFLPVVGRYGYYAMFLFWVGCTIIYFLTVLFFLPETKGKTLEEIEQCF